MINEYPEDIIKLQRLSLECKRPSSTSDRESKIEASEPLYITSDEYVPCVDTIHKDKECFIGLNDSLLPLKKFLQKLLNRNIECLGAEKSLKNAYEKQLRDKSEQKYDYPYEAYEFEKRKDYHNIIPEWKIKELFVPFVRFHAIYENTKLRKNYEALERRYQPVIDQSMNLAGSISLLNGAMESYGCDCGKESGMCIVYFEKESNKVKIESVRSGELRRFNDFVNSEEFGKFSTIKKMESLCERLRSAESDMKSCVSLKSKEEFFLMTGRANVILEAFERCFQDNSLEELTAMSQLRKFLNKCALEYKFKFASETEPILGVNISRCKLIVDGPSRKMFFVEKEFVPIYMRSIKDHIYIKAQNLAGKCNIEDFSEKDLEEMKRKLSEESKETIIKNLQNDQKKLNADAGKMETKAKEYFKKSTLSRIDLIGSVLKFGFLCVEWGIDKMNELISMIPQSVQSYLWNVLGLSTDKKEVGTSKEVISQSDANQIKRKFPELNLSPRHIEEFTKGCMCMIDANEMRKKCDSIENEVEFWKQVSSGEFEFLNLLKLKAMLIRSNYTETECVGLLIDEVEKVKAEGVYRAKGRDFNEYFVRVVN
ncbi:uncharacterized protein MONOS_14591 [Monocercomonoides exilis]|uniref:uncharacterized protein n=1 Tax=Monocercomonoides exilis TaxID=2049356 RepID=UPI00355A70FE|nr:hypothetical protein MONOS_14591 [Monocercomonoides exilis]|eukprot:MONOS_14591.1-p1 / transcript=MONOS_14591.1 / gene=MONOS_14591 / organism=Monocercomonoides_exilis_PA203 / gene_product=unspecified product / transcript_product=unspecified product / location=Mono_scaffold01029:14602-16392(-) / protein_length=597 / sequence_SO=supercontig / SO=protein_coding / is_pseudo=false